MVLDSGLADTLAAARARGSLCRDWRQGRRAVGPIPDHYQGRHDRHHRRLAGRRARLLLGGNRHPAGRGQRDRPGPHPGGGAVGQAAGQRGDRVHALDTEGQACPDPAQLSSRASWPPPEPASSSAPTRTCRRVPAGSAAPSSPTAWATSCGGSAPTAPATGVLELTLHPHAPLTAVHPRDGNGHRPAHRRPRRRGTPGRRPIRQPAHLRPARTPAILTAQAAYQGSTASITAILRSRWKPKWLPTVTAAQPHPDSLSHITRWARGRIADARRSP